MRSSASEKLDHWTTAFREFEIEDRKSLTHRNFPPTSHSSRDRHQNLLYDLVINHEFLKRSFLHPVFDLLWDTLQMQRIRAGRGVGKGTVAQPDIKVVSMWSAERHSYEGPQCGISFKRLQKRTFASGCLTRQRLWMYDRSICKRDWSREGR